MRILITSIMPPRVPNGVSAYYTTIHDMAVMAGHSVECITSADCGLITRFFVVWFLRFSLIFGRAGQQVATRFVYFPMFCSACWGKSADVVFAQDPITGHAARLALKKRVPVVVACHFSEPVGEVVAAFPAIGCIGKWVLHKWFAWNFSGIANYICVSNYVKSNLLPWLRPGCRVTVIHNGATIPAQTSTDLQKPPGKKVILNVGRIEPLKNQELLVRTVAAMQRRDIVLWLVGDGVQRAELARLAQELGIVEQVCFLGHRQDVQAIMRLADLYVHVSKMENCPLVIAEAMLNRLPVLATDVGGTKELFPAPEVSIFPINCTASDLAAKMLFLLAHPQELQTMQWCQHQFAMANFTPKIMFEKTLAVLTEASTNRAPPCKS